MQDLVTVQNITKRFGERAAVDRLSFTVRRGEVFALLGPNGAGKTTAVRMLAGIIRPDDGRIAITIDGRTTDALPPGVHFKLIESVAEHICETLFVQDARVESVTVRIVKLAISENGERIGITLTRERRD